MADRSGDDVENLDDIDEGPANEGRILSPEELDISKSEHVEELEEGRFVVSPDGPPDPGPAKREETSSSDSRNRQSESPRQDDDPSDFTQQSETQRGHSETQPQGGGQSRRQPRNEQPQQEPRSAPSQRQQSEPQQNTELTQEQVHQWLQASFENGNSTYGFDVTATFEGSTSQRRMASNDVVTIFESLMLWYAQQVDNNTPVEEILGILLMESNVPVRYPPESLHQLIKSSNLTPEDSIGDLLEEIDDGVQF
ncbi:hypothetical protein ACFQJ7_07495 [Halovenus rubra]|uniref:Uncharacterized protein n=2 Tax=Halovenus rubra TaxID=869890 RepID=A0ABD5X8I2_9EURY|nr:hypothetical protein [Halovenus rubra]